MRRFTFPMINVLLMLSLFLAGCGSGRPPDQTAQEDIDTWELGRRGGSFTFVLDGEIATLFPPLSVDEIEQDVLHALFLSPLDRDYVTGRWTGVLAESWSVSEGGRTVSVKLKNGIGWSDGEPITSRDIVDSVELFYRNEFFESVYSDILNEYGQDVLYSVIDEKSFTVTIPEASTATFLLLTLPALPVHILRPVLEQEGPEGFFEFWLPGSDLEEVVVSGPFRPARFEDGERITLERNPRFFMKDERGRRLPYLDEVTALFGTDEENIHNSFYRGESDWFMAESRELSENEEEWKEYVIDVVGETPATTFLVFNQKPLQDTDEGGIAPPKLTWFSNRSFRTAMAHLVNRPRMVEEAAFGNAVPQFSFEPRVSPYFWKGAEEHAPSYDPDKASQILDILDYRDRDEDGIREDPDGNPVSFSLITNDNPIRVATGRIIAEEARAVGVNIEFEILDFMEVIDRLIGGRNDFEAVIIGFTGNIDTLATGSHIYGSDGIYHLIEPEQEQPRREWEKRMDELVGQAQTTLTFDKKQKIYKEAQRIWLDESPWIFTIAELYHQIHRGEFGNLRPHPLRRSRLPLHRIFRKRA